MSEAATAPRVQPCSGLRLRANLVGKLNLADYQNSVAALRELEVVNDTALNQQDLRITASSEPAFFTPKHWRIDAIGPGQTCRISALDLQLEGPLFARLTESETARVRMELAATDRPSEVFYVFEQDIELLPRNHWGGLSHSPEMLAAYVQPNDAAIDRLLKRAALVLRNDNRNSSLNGYESGVQHAWEILSAIWSAAAAERFDYALPPASFEQTGQKVRSPGQIFESGIATCLDLALLFAAAIEQAGLNPIVVFTSGHALTGCWLCREEFSTVVVDDASALRKRLFLQELVLFETTLVTGSSAAPFSQACELGRKQLDEDAASAFEAAVDVRRARMHKIKPLAAPDTAAGKVHQTLPEGEVKALPIEDPPDLPEDLTAGAAEPDPKSLSPTDRVTRWQRKLLDLSLRNSLLNFRKNKRAVGFEAPDPGRLEDVIASGKALRILPRPDLMDGADLRNRALHETRTHEDVRRQHAVEGLTKFEVFAKAGAEELESTLIELYRSARVSLEEGGANTLFLALGFLIWTPNGKDGQRHRAPLVLIPVTLNRRSVRSGFTLTLHEDEPQFNPTLVEMLKQDFQLNLGIAEGDLPKDDSGLDVKGIWNRVSAAIKDIGGWEVVPDAVLSTFSFAKHLMWKDLVQRTEQLRQNPVVRHLIDTPREQYQSDVVFADGKRLDREIDPREMFCPLPADSSQLAAVLSAARGKDFVLIGPPGTGKSQTISNLIAHCIGSGKRVLFVAEKMAALNVVYRRLHKEGLGQFCLEMHSSKARKADVLKALATAWSDRGTANAEAWEAEAVRLKELRDRLNLYVERLHQVRPNGLTVHRALGTTIAGDNIPCVDLPWPDPSSHDFKKLEAFRAIIAKLDVHSTALGVDDLTGTSLRPVGQANWSPLWQSDFQRSIREAQSAAAQFQTAYAEFASLTGLPTDLVLTAEKRAAAAELARAIPECTGRKWNFTVRADSDEICKKLQAASALVADYRAISGRIELWPGHVIAVCRKGIVLVREREALRGSLPAPWPSSVVATLQRGIGLLEKLTSEEGQLSARYDPKRVNASALYAEWQRAQGSIWPLSLIGRRRVTGVLASAMAEGGQPDPTADLPRLAEMEKVRADIEGIDLHTLPPGVWSGLQTEVEVAKAALRFQSELSAMRRGESGATDNLEAVASGLCGPEMKQTLASMRRVNAIDSEIVGLEWLQSATGGVWMGARTNCDLLSAALDFCDSCQLEALCSDVPAVATGQCGDGLRIQYELAKQRDTLARRIREVDGDLGSRTDGVWQGLNTEVSEVDRALAFRAVLVRTLPTLLDQTAPAAMHSTGLERLFQAAGAQRLQTSADGFLKACSRFGSAGVAMAQQGSFPAVDIADLEYFDPKEVQSLCARLNAAAPRLQRWCSWVEVREQARAFGLIGFVNLIETGAIQPQELSRAFEVNYSRWWLNHVVTGDEILRTFVSTEHERRISDFRALDDRYTALTSKWIKAKLCASTPTSDSVKVNSEWGILHHEITKKKRHLPLRELMERIPSVVTTLTPCLLMSPLSVAQYLALSSAAFDVVIFDEASQITVWDAIGAIARAKQVIMVGDPKQLPPSNFFGKADEEPDQSDDVPEDLESILDECIGANLPSLQLDWHYRSRHESLIAFSNRRYYDGKLVTFPSPVTDDRAVSFHYVKGVYEKGGARTNKEEARAVVRDIVSNLKSPEFVNNGYSIGVVTFNAEQQKLIEDLLDAERRSDPELEPHFGQDRLEPVFVKNLESVQGDERDIIYFSITFGPDLAGKLSMNFGPMNRDGGERRLNVAITRARRALRVFSTMRPERIDLSRTQARGVSELKHFLEFAERGPRAFAETVTGSLGDFESPFEQYVAAALKSRGWAVHTQIGASDFRVDLGVVHPDAPGIYLVGIECDGATYHRSATARDRDKLREQVLRDLGWTVLRVWSTDWWLDRDSTLNELDRKLRSILEESRTQWSAYAIETQVASSAEPGGSETSDDVSTEAQELETVPVGADASKFFEAAYNPELIRMVKSIVASEGPILDAVLYRRIARMHGWQRTGVRINERVKAIALAECGKTEEEAIGTFFWPQDPDGASSVQFRSGLDRAVDEICMPELISLAVHVLAAGKSGDEAVEAMAKAIGLQRLRAGSRIRLEAAILNGQQKQPS